MAFFFGRTKSNSSLTTVQNAKNHLVELIDNPAVSQQPAKEAILSKELATIKGMVQGPTFEEEPKPEKVQELVDNLINTDFFLPLVRSIHLLSFNGRKDAQAILGYAFRFRPANSTSEETPAVSYIVNSRPEVLVALCQGYVHRVSATACGTVLREVLKSEMVAALIFYDQSKEGEPALKASELEMDQPQTGEGVFWRYFNWIDESAFEIGADAFTTFRDLLTKHKTITAHYLQQNFDLFFQRYHRVLIESNSYVTKRQSIKLLGELLLDRANYNVMTAYVDRGDHLKVSMNLLRDDRKMVQYEGFHVFKVFVANPNKSEAIIHILRKNREKLLAFLPNFLADRTQDEQFQDEKAFLIRSIDALPSLDPSTAAAQASEHSGAP